MATETAVKAARKEHSCSFCGAPIPMGESYLKVRLTPWDHSENEDFATWKAHHYCYDLWYKIAADFDHLWSEGDYMEFRQYGDEKAPWLQPESEE